MVPLVVQLTDVEFKRLEELWPKARGHSAIGARAMEITRIYLKRKHPECHFEAPVRGADLNVRLSTDTPSQPIEVKGTEAADLAWSQLKVSSTESMKLLAEKSAPVYRVCDVFGQSPRIYILIHGKDFVLAPEARWAFKSVKQAALVPTKQATQTKVGLNAKRSKYDTLRVWLQAQGGNTVTLRFADAQRVLSFALPASAYTYQAFWANQRTLANRPWAKAWTTAGFRVEQFKLSPNGWARFRRVGRPMSQDTSNA